MKVIRHLKQFIKDDESYALYLESGVFGENKGSKRRYIMFMSGTIVFASYRLGKTLDKLIESIKNTLHLP